MMIMLTCYASTRACFNDDGGTAHVRWLLATGEFFLMAMLVAYVLYSLSAAHCCC